MSVPVFITYRDRFSFLQRALASYFERGFTDITVIDNDSLAPLSSSNMALLAGGEVKVVRTDNEHRQLAPWLIAGLIPDDTYYIVADCDVELDCPGDVESVLIDVLERHPSIEKVGLGIRVDDLLFPPPDRYAYSYLMEYSVERGTRFKEIGYAGEERFALARGDNGPDFYVEHDRSPVIDAPVDTHFAMHRPGHGWPGIVGARTTAPYLCRHLPWYEAEYTDDEKLYYSRAGKVWAMGHSADTLLKTTVAVPFTELRAETVAALHGEEVRYAPMLYDEGYWELLRDLCADGRPFAIVEHDVVVRETTLDELRICEHDWCAMPFPYRGEEKAYSLACTRFSADLIARHPDLMEVVGEMWDDSHPKRHWCRLDMWIFGVLTSRGEKRHEHSRSEPVGHIGAQFPKHGCL